MSEHLYLSQRPFSRQTWLGSARNFARTRFKRFRTFDFSTQKKKSAKISDEIFCFLLIWCGFGRATAKRTSKSASGSNFAPDRLILRSVRTNIVKNGGGRIQMVSLQKVRHNVNPSSEYLYLMNERLTDQHSNQLRERTSERRCERNERTTKAEQKNT